jgi:hypothetical protein
MILLGLFPDARVSSAHLSRLSSPSPIKLAGWTELDRANAKLGPSPVFRLIGQTSHPEANSNGASQSAARLEPGPSRLVSSLSAMATREGEKALAYTAGGPGGCSPPRTFGKTFYTPMQKSPVVLFSSVQVRDYLNCSFWDAPRPRTSSYTWRSILFGRDLLEVGVRWGIGSGTRIRIESDNWIPDVPPSMLRPLVPLAEDQTVNTLFLQDR